VSRRDFDAGEGYGFPTMPIAVGLAAVMVVAAGAWAFSRVKDQHPPPGVVAVPAGTGTFPATARPGATQEIVGLSYGPDPAQRIDLYRPPGDKSKLPVLAYLHSGGWLSGTLDQVPDFLLQEVTRMHVELASVGYRLSGAHGTNPFPDAPDDVDRAVRWLTANAAFFAIDPAKVVLTGTSAGGHLAALTGAAPGTFTEPGLPHALMVATPHIIGVIDAVGPSDLTSMAREGGLAAGMVTEFLDCPSLHPTTCNPDALRAASIAPHLGTSAPPAFLVYGKHDTLVPPSTQGSPLAAAWAAARGDIQRDPGARGVWYEIANDGHNVSQASIDMTALEQWLSEVLSGKLR
jgi:acetyl esterase/lipase